MNWKHLFWIVPLSIAIGYIIGVNDVLYMIRSSVNLEEFCKLI